MLRMPARSSGARPSLSPKSMASAVPIMETPRSRLPRLSRAFETGRGDPLVGELGSQAVSALTAVDRAPAHQRQERFCTLERVGLAAAHERQRRVPCPDHACRVVSREDGRVRRDGPPDTGASIMEAPEAMTSEATLLATTWSSVVQSTHKVSLRSAGSSSSSSGSRPLSGSR